MATTSEIEKSLEAFKDEMRAAVADLGGRIGALEAATGSEGEHEIRLDNHRADLDALKASVETIETKLSNTTAPVDMFDADTIRRQIDKIHRAVFGVPAGEIQSLKAVTHE